MLSLSKAAKVVGVSKATIHRAIKSGRISAVRQDDGSYLIDPAELNRVYPAISSSDNGGTSETGSPKRTATASALAVMAAELAGARQLIESLRHQVDDLRHDRDAWRQQAEAAQNLLVAARDTARPPPATPSPGRSFWKRSEEQERGDRRE